MAVQFRNGSSRERFNAKARSRKDAQRKQELGIDDFLFFCLIFLGFARHRF